MSNIVILEPKQHGDLKVDTALINAHAADQHMMPVMLSEFVKLAACYPLVLTKDIDSGQFSAVALFGFEQGENLFWKQNRWDSIYVPLNIQRQPFFLGNRDQSGNNQQNYVVCFDKNSPAFASGRGEQLFAGDDQPSEYLQTVRSILTQLLDGEQQNKTFIEKLVALDLLSPLSLDITFKNNEQQTISGVYTIDEEKLAALSADQIADLHTSGYMPCIYAMVVSLGQIYGLIERKNQLSEQADAWFSQQAGS